MKDSILKTLPLRVRQRQQLSQRGRGSRANIESHLLPGQYQAGACDYSRHESANCGRFNISDDMTLLYDWGDARLLGKCLFRLMSFLTAGDSVWTNEFKADPP